MDSEVAECQGGREGEMGLLIKKRKKKIVKGSENTVVFILF